MIMKILPKAWVIKQIRALVVCSLRAKVGAGRGRSFHLVKCIDVVQLLCGPCEVASRKVERWGRRFIFYLFLVNAIFNGCQI